MTVTLPSPCSVRSGSALGCQCSDGSSAKAAVDAPSSFRVGRYVAYLESPTGASTLIESTPPGMKTDTSTRCPGATAARATPSSNAPSPSFEAPYTDIASPAERSTNERLERPVPAGAGMPGSMSGSPAPARAAALRRSCEREKSRQQSAMGSSAGLVVGCGGHELAQCVLAHGLVGRDLPRLHGGRQARARERDQRSTRIGGDRRVVEEVDRARDGGLCVLGLVVGGVPGVDRAAPVARLGGREVGDREARAPGRGVEPGGVVPARDVRRVEE